MSGPELERERSRTFHAEGVPLLVSPLLLRARDLGQLDLARVKKEREEWVVEIAEVKASTVGEERLMRGQWQRLRAAQNFLAGLLGHRTRFIRLVGE